MMRKMRPALPGKGNDYRGQRRIVIGFDEDTFEQIRTRAFKKGTSFAEEARLLIEWGLEAERAA
jgi:hypothetical protein